MDSEPPSLAPHTTACPSRSASAPGVGQAAAEAKCQEETKAALILRVAKHQAEMDVAARQLQETQASQRRYRYNLILTQRLSLAKTRHGAEPKNIVKAVPLIQKGPVEKPEPAPLLQVEEEAPADAGASASSQPLAANKPGFKVEPSADVLRRNSAYLAATSHRAYLAAKKRRCLKAEPQAATEQVVQRGISVNRAADTGASDDSESVRRRGRPSVPDTPDHRIYPRDGAARAASQRRAVLTPQAEVPARRAVLTLETRFRNLIGRRPVVLAAHTVPTVSRSPSPHPQSIDSAESLRRRRRRQTRPGDPIIETHWHFCGATTFGVVSVCH